MLQSPGFSGSFAKTTSYCRANPCNDVPQQHFSYFSYHEQTKNLRGRHRPPLLQSDQNCLNRYSKSSQLELQLVIAGSALLDRYGNAVDFIEKDGFPIAAKVFMVLEGENPTTMAKTTGLGVMELTNVFYNLKPDAVITIADRFETIATSIAAAYQNIPLVHVQGGEVTGSIDEKVRHSNTKLADLHLVSSEDARKRVIKLGEDPEKVINTGCPSIDLAKKVS